MMSRLVLPWERLRPTDWVQTGEPDAWRNTLGGRWRTRAGIYWIGKTPCQIAILMGYAAPTLVRIMRPFEELA